MTIKTIPLLDLVAVLRRPFELLTVDGSPVGDRRTGEPVFTAEVVVPGLVAGRFSTDDRPSAVRVKLLGAAPPSLEAGSVVRLVGGKLTTWYVPRARGRDARSAATITVERVEPAAGETPVLRGGLPAHLAGAGAMFLGQSGEWVDVMLDAAGPFTVAGVVEVRCPATIPGELLAQQVAPVGLRAFFTAPDAEDVGQRTKAELILSCTGFAPVGGAQANGRARKSDADTTAVAQ